MIIDAYQLGVTVCHYPTGAGEGVISSVALPQFKYTLPAPVELLRPIGAPGGWLELPSRL